MIDVILEVTRVDVDELPAVALVDSIPPLPDNADGPIMAAPRITIAAPTAANKTIRRPNFSVKKKES